MNWTMISLISGAVFAALTYLAGMYMGEQLGKLNQLGEQNKQADHIIVKQEVLIKEVPKIVTRVVTVTTTIEKEYTADAAKLPDLFDPACTMPKWWGELFVNAANGLPAPDPRSDKQGPGAYGCLETAQATLSDLKAGTINSARLSGLKQFTQLLTKEK